MTNGRVQGRGRAETWRQRRSRVRWKIHGRRRSSNNPSLPYTARDGLLSPGELAFFRVLRRAIGGRYSISIKTRLADVIFCPEELWESPHGRKLSQKHLDFVLYDASSARVIAAIELDDRSHNRPERRARDRFVDDALRAGGVCLLRLPAAARYDRHEIWSALQAAFSQSIP